MSEVLNCRVSSNPENLQRIHETIAPWMIGKDNIRPNPQQIEQKNMFLKIIEGKFATFADSVLISMFDCESVLVDGKLAAKPFSVDVKDKKLFCPALFPYQCPQGTNHYVMWYLLSSIQPEQLSDDSINIDISEQISALDSSANREYDFCWYPNPKPTISGDMRVHHVQVFWRFRIKKPNL